MALLASSESNHREAGRLVERIVQQHGPEVIPEVLCAWVDTVLANSGFRPGGMAGVVWRAQETGDYYAADDVPAPTRWAGRFFAARTNDDRAQAEALINSATSDEEWSLNVAALLLVCGLQLRDGVKTVRTNPLIRSDRGDL